MTRTWGFNSRRGSIAASLLGCAAVLAAYVLLALNSRASLAAPTSPASATTTGTGTVVSTRTTGIGLVVVAGSAKHTVYLFTRDDPGVSHCGSTCQQTWHRVKTNGKPIASGGITQSKLGQTTHHQVTYYGHPLYYYAGDTTAGTTHGQGLTSFGGRWWVVGKNGKAGTGALVRLHSTPDGSAVAGALGSGRTLYMLSSDGATKSTCASTCASIWPALYTVGKPRAGSGITASLIKTFVRSNGQRQVTYNGHPLYYYSGDSSAGFDYGECFYEGPGTWYILSAAGRAVKAPCSTGTPTPSTSSSAPAPGPCDTTAPADATISVSAAAKSHGATSLGNILEDSRGCTVYMYTGDPSGTAKVSSPTWPPVTSGAAPAAGTGLSCTLGTTQTANIYDGTTQQVTCNGHPLYYYAPDSATTDTGGQGIFDGVNYWYVLDATGTAVTA
jgi:predicted lipoprotein with Yx(FWY)xxD motif